MSNDDPTIVIDDELGIKLFHMRAQLSAMELEAKGLRHSSGRSVSKFVKNQYGLKGPRRLLVEQFKAVIKETEKERAEKITNSCPTCGAQPNEDCKRPVTQNCLHPKQERQNNG